MDSKQRIKEEFTYYLSNIARSSRRTDKGFNLQPTAVQSFLAFLEVDRLFDYNPGIWQHIKSMYDITSPNEVENIADTLLNDEDFIKHDKEKNQSWRSGSIIHYVCFIKARSYFMHEKNEEIYRSPDQKTINKVPFGVQYSTYRPYITAIKSKPFLLLAGISGTGKSRIVRELARACWDEGTDKYKAQKPKNFQMVQVKPNWHDSSDLIGYVSRVSGKAEFVAGEFLKFIAKAWENTETPYFLCLDEMNLAPVEQYFAEYLSVIESRKSHENEVDLHGGLTERNEPIGKLDKAELIGYAVDGVDVYAANKEVCETVLTYLDAVNSVLESTPFKVAYRTRNEFLLYVVNNLPYSKGENDEELPQGYVVARALDEITSMKVLSRIEGDDTKVSDKLLDSLTETIEEGLREVLGEENTVKSISLAKLKEMKDKLVSGYTSFWS